jgi:hypothetical protein
MVAVPTATPVTTPVLESTVATPVASDDQVIVLLDASAGVTEVERVIVEPTSTDDAPEISFTPVTATDCTVKVRVDVNVPFFVSDAVAVMVTVPGDTPCIRPFAYAERLTVAILGSDDVNVASIQKLAPDERYPYAYTSSSFPGPTFTVVMASFVGTLIGEIAVMDAVAGHERSARVLIHA